MESSVFNVLILAAFGLMAAVTAGVGYLTLAEWRDRRRQDQDLRANKPAKKRRQS